MKMSIQTVILLLLFPQVIICAVVYQPIQTYSPTTEVPGTPRIVPANGNYSVSFVPLLTIIANVLPRIVNRFRPVTTTQRAKSLTTTNVPPEFSNTNPCIDNILVRKPFPDSKCYFYQCELNKPTKPTCAIQAIPDAVSLPPISKSGVNSKSSAVRISECMAIRLYKCLNGHEYDEYRKICVKLDSPLQRSECLI